jgi:hypothetical protein
MPLVNLDEESELYADIAAHCKERTEEDYIDRSDDDWRAAVMMWKQAKEIVDLALERERKNREYLIEVAKGRNVQGFGVKAKKIVRKGSINYSDIPELQQISLDKYRKPSIESWRITLDDKE